MYVRGVGPRVAEMLAPKGILTAEDLLYHLPFRYEDRQNPRSLDELQPGETTVGTKVQIVNKRGNKGKLVVEYYSLDDFDRILEVVRK